MSGSKTYTIFAGSHAHRQVGTEFAYNALQALTDYAARCGVKRDDIITLGPKSIAAEGQVLVAEEVVA